MKLQESSFSNKYKLISNLKHLILNFNRNKMGRNNNNDNKEKTIRETRNPTSEKDKKKEAQMMETVETTKK